MKKSILKISGLLLITAVATIFWAGTTNKSNVRSIERMATIYDFKLKTIDGEEITLARFKGKKMLLINTASECGFTPQYKNLQALHEQYGSKVVLIGFPANNFGKQEPGTNAEIKGFCTKNYGVTFQMMDKISVAGADADPLYKWLSDKQQNGVCENAPNWNFCKYLIDEKGNIIKFFPSKVDPLSKDITSLL
ncbi:MAG: glutathione peroxidase [Bacteroidia bacterium]